ncbi:MULTISPECIES: hypothetical protein [Streptomyces]|uniref:hypothetical protein n=1 Tax=Streptomyces TaxID=1883 RepID=UPI001487F877|nr:MULTISPECIES: hypothetical protein [Streptomyces]
MTGIDLANGMEGLEISRTVLDNHATVRLRLRPTDYFTFLVAEQLDRRLPR